MGHPAYTYSLSKWWSSTTKIKTNKSNFSLIIIVSDYLDKRNYPTMPVKSDNWYIIGLYCPILSY